MITAGISVPLKKDTREDLVDIGHYEYINGSNFVMSKEIRSLDNLAAVAGKYGLGIIRNGVRSRFLTCPFPKWEGKKLQQEDNAERRRSFTKKKVRPLETSNIY